MPFCLLALPLVSSLAVPSHCLLVQQQPLQLLWLSWLLAFISFGVPPNARRWQTSERPSSREVSDPLFPQREKFSFSQGSLGRLCQQRGWGDPRHCPGKSLTAHLNRARCCEEVCEHKAFFDHRTCRGKRNGLKKERQTQEKLNTQDRDK